MEITDKAKRFKNLHAANAWSADSAVLLEEAGIEAIGTTSAGIAFSHALPDYKGELSFDTVVDR